MPLPVMSVSSQLNIHHQSSKKKVPVKDSSITDVSIESADGKIFHLQRKYLEANTGGFPSAEFDTRGELVHLTETSTVLETLFRFAYPTRQPDLENESFEVISGVAEAAEKYEVFSAMNFCRLRMRQFLPKYAVEILGYAVKHDYHNIIKEAVPHAARLPLLVVFDHLPTCFFRPWIKYHEAWRVPFDNAFRTIVLVGTARSMSVVPSRPCQVCGMALFTMVMELQALRSLDKLDQALTKPRERSRSCLGQCAYNTIAEQVTKDIAISTKNIPPFESFLKELTAS